HNRREINGSKGSLSWDLERMNELELYIEEGPQSGFRTLLATHPPHPDIKDLWPTRPPTPNIPTSRPGGLPATSSATSTRSLTRSTTSCAPSPPGRRHNPTSRTA